MDDLFGSRDIPPEIYEHIFYLAGPNALASVRCTNQANAEAYSGVALSLAKRGQWRCRLDTRQMLQYAINHRLQCLRVVSYNSEDLAQILSLEWLTELYIHLFEPPPDLLDLQLHLPKLKVFESYNLRIQTLDLGSAASLEWLVWCEGQKFAGEESGEEETDEESDDDEDGGLTRFLVGPLPSSLASLQCNLKSGLELPPLPPLLEHLDLSTSRLDSDALPALPATLSHLDCNNCGLTHLPDNLPPNIRYLDVSFNMISALPALPPGLTYLRCHCNGSLPLPAALPKGLRVLWCGGNRLASLPPLPATLRDLTCSFNNLFTLPSPLPSNLTTLVCSVNNLRRLPDLPRTLKHMMCEFQAYGMEELPALHHTALEVLVCSGNGLRSLPRLPETLQRLDCSENAMTSVPPLPSGLDVLHCDKAALNVIDLPQSVRKCLVFAEGGERESVR